MNEYDRLHRQAQRYKELYPKGTRILLLHMATIPDLLRTICAAL